MSYQQSHEVHSSTERLHCALCRRHRRGHRHKYSSDSDDYDDDTYDDSEEDERDRRGGVRPWEVFELLTESGDRIGDVEVNVRLFLVDDHTKPGPFGGCVVLLFGALLVTWHHGVHTYRWGNGDCAGPSLRSH